MSEGIDRSELSCRVVELPEEHQLMAAQTAIVQNPMNRPGKGGVIEVPHLVLYTSKWWGVTGVRLTVGFMEQTAPDLRDRILSHMNAWGQFCNVRFSWSQTDAQVRIAFAREGYWSNLGTDCLLVDRNRPTMNLQQFTMLTPESEYRRVVRHETGHTLGFPHEHLRSGIVALLDPAKTIAYFQATQNWNEGMTRGNVLTPLKDSELVPIEGNPVDTRSIMAYQLPRSITTNNQPIPGGDDIDAQDAAMAARYYPPATPPGSKLMTRAQYEQLKAAGQIFDHFWEGNGQVSVDVNNNSDVSFRWQLISYQIAGRDLRNATELERTGFIDSPAKSGNKNSGPLKLPTGDYSLGVAVEGVEGFVAGKVVIGDVVPPTKSRVILEFDGIVQNPRIVQG